jgi:hypothetical protein
LLTRYVKRPNFKQMHQQIRVGEIQQKILDDLLDHLVKTWRHVAAWSGGQAAWWNSQLIRVDDFPFI